MQTDAESLPDDPDEERQPSDWRFLLSPTAVFWSLLSWLEGWLLSRHLLLLLFATPFLTGIVYVISTCMRLATEESNTIALYAKTLESLQQQGDLQTQENIHRALIGLQPDNPQFSLNLIDFLWQNQKRAEATERMLNLISSGAGNTAPANLMRARHLLTEGTPAARRKAIEHLSLAAEQQPTDFDILSLLSSTLLQEGEYNLASSRLQQLAESHPIRGVLKLLRLLHTIGSITDAEVHVKRAEGILRTKLLNQDITEEERLQFAELLMLTSRPEEALSLISAALETKPTSALREKYAIAAIEVARAGIEESAVNAPAALKLTNSSLRQSIGNEPALRMAKQLAERGYDIDHNLLDALNDYWSERLAESSTSPDIRLNYSRVLGLMQRNEEAARILEGLDTIPSVASVERVEHLVQSNQKALALELARNLLQYSLEHSEDKNATGFTVDCLISAQLYEQARELILETAPVSRLSIKMQQRLSSTYIRLFDQLTGRPPESSAETDRWIPDLEASERDPAELIRLLSEAADLASGRVDAADRLMRIAVSDSPYASTAQREVDQIRAVGADAELLFERLGTICVVNERYDEAYRYLTSARRIQDGGSPQTLNNLALTIARGRIGSSDEALIMINLALTSLPDHPVLLASRGEIFLLQRSLREARIDLEKSLSLQGGRSEVHRLLAEVLQELDEPELAKEQLEIAESLER